MFRWFLIVLSLVVTAVSPAHAKTKVEIYQVTVPLETGKTGQSKAWTQGLKQVLIKASGDQNISNSPVVQKALAKSSDYLEQYKNVRADGATYMDMTFNSIQIQTLLSQSDAPFWPELRESILVWEVEDDGQERNLVWEQAGGETTQMLKSISEQTGLPLLLPIGDMEDVTNIAATDVWGSFLEPITQASARYSVDAILLLKHQIDGDESLSWELYDLSPDQIMGSNIEPLKGVELGQSDQTYQQVLANVASYYAKKNKSALLEKSGESQLVTVIGLQNFAALYQLKNQVDQLSSVASVEVKNLQTNRVTLDVTLLSSQEEFLKQLGSISSLKALTQQEQTQEQAKLSENSNDMVWFQLVKK